MEPRPGRREGFRDNPQVTPCKGSEMEGGGAVPREKKRLPQAAATTPPILNCNPSEDFQKQEPTDRKGFDFKLHVRPPFCVAMVLAKELSLEKKTVVC